jgi:hemerythrin-like domain-containing protein
MKPTDILSAEHRVIEQVLGCLEKMVQDCSERGQLDEPSAADAISFFKVFADRCHHGKEEVHLFPAMEAKGFPRESGPTGVMLREHEEGRQYVRGMEASLTAAAGGDAQAQKQFCRNARGYIHVLRDHIHKEDHCLFGMANQAFTEQDQRDLLAKFDAVEHEEMGAGTHEKYLAIANRLADRYGVAKAAPVATCGCSHHH